ncbi:MAG: hypothetical protein WCT29_00190 [Candidatus Paceibacterota bacterium]|jgi:hypothetical protein
MSEENKEKLNTDWSLKELSETEQDNVLGFFALLLKVDKRVNPHLYVKEKYARYSNPNNP